MFKALTKNIGESIKKLAKIIYIVNIVLAVLSFVVGIIVGIVLVADGEDAVMFFAGLGGGIGAAVSFIISAIIYTMLIYGFGDLISSNIKIKNHFTGEDEKQGYVPPKKSNQPFHQAPPPIQPANQMRPPVQPVETVVCARCGNVMNVNVSKGRPYSVYCDKCGENVVL